MPHLPDVPRQTPEPASPARKAAQALELMRLGIELKRAQLRTRFPQASEAEVEAMVRAWRYRE